MTSQQARVPEVSTAEKMMAVESGVHSSLVVAGVVATTNILGDSCPSTQCPIVIDVQPPNDCEATEQHLSDSEHAQSPACDDVACSQDVVKCSSPSRSCGRLGRMLSRLTVRDHRRQTAGKQHQPDDGNTQPMQRCHSWSGCSRRVAIESSLSVERSPNVGRRRQAAAVDVEHDDRPIQQFTTSLTSTDVRDGRFTARLPVDAMPRGDVMIRMRSGRLEVLLQDEEGAAGACRLHGVIELPMYVDMDSVTLRHDPLNQSLVIDASTKGYQRHAGPRRRSVSLDELWWPARGREIAHRLNVRLMTWKRREQEETVVLFSETRAVAGGYISHTSHD